LKKEDSEENSEDTSEGDPDENKRGKLDMELKDKYETRLHY
jgi:hypothetical protein